MSRDQNLSSPFHRSFPAVSWLIRVGKEEYTKYKENDMHPTLPTIQTGCTWSGLGTRILWLRHLTFVHGKASFETLSHFSLQIYLSTQFHQRVSLSQHSGRKKKSNSNGCYFKRVLPFEDKANCSQSSAWISEMGGRVMRGGRLRSMASFALLIILLLQEIVTSETFFKRSDGLHFEVVRASTDATAGRRHALKKKLSVPVVRRDMGCIAEPQLCSTHKHEKCCRGRCRNVHNDAMNCGACGRFCPQGYAYCAGSCVDLSRDHGNCGKCGNVCPSGLTCQRGSLWLR
ncbi:hypothetical protein KP509_1Z134600 [Ceratopteris richardii]|nr:hypothetical protein KP509_1Z134600 [Ceratopteris richardii]